MLHAQEPKYGLFFVAAVSSGIDTNSWQFATFAPALDGEHRDTENLSNFTNGEQIWQVGKVYVVRHKFVV